MNPSGVFNKTMATGIGLFILDKAATEFFGAEYRSLDGVQPIVRGLAKGLFIGGIVGGFFDPYAAKAGSPTPTSFPVAAPAAQLSAYTGSAGAVNRMLGG